MGCCARLRVMNVKKYNAGLEHGHAAWLSAVRAGSMKTRRPGQRPGEVSPVRPRWHVVFFHGKNLPGRLRIEFTATDLNPA